MTVVSRRWEVASIPKEWDSSSYLTTVIIASRGKSPRVLPCFLYSNKDFFQRAKLLMVFSSGAILTGNGQWKCCRLRAEGGREVFKRIKIWLYFEKNELGVQRIDFPPCGSLLLLEETRELNEQDFIIVIDQICKSWSKVYSLLELNSPRVVKFKNKGGGESKV